MSEFSQVFRDARRYSRIARSVQRQCRPRRRSYQRPLANYGEPRDFRLCPTAWEWECCRALWDPVERYLSRFVAFRFFWMIEEFSWKRK